MLLNLKNTTLLFVETRAHEITKRVIEDCISKADFGDILIFSDQPERIPVAGARYELVPDFPNKKLAGQFYYASAMSRVETDFALMLEWDAGIFDPSKWKPEFFNYDYVGAPWVVRPGDMHDVGNGGFTLMSKGLGHYAVENFKRLGAWSAQPRPLRLPRRVHVARHPAQGRSHRARPADAQDRIPDGQGAATLQRGPMA
jgi:hypothetical protein